MPVGLQILLASLSTVAAIASACAAFYANSVSKRTFQWQQNLLKSSVQVTCKPDPHAPQIILLVIENTGASIAYDVQFEFSKPIPKRAYGFVEGATSEQRAEAGRKLREALPAMDDGPLVTGIPALGVGDRRVITWGQYGGLSSWLEEGFVVVKANFTDQTGEPIVTSSVLEVRSFETTDASERDPKLRSAKALEDLAKFVNNPRWESKPILVESAAAHRRAQEEWAKNVRKQRQQAEQNEAS